MNPKIENIKSVGFDLDNTLYKQDSRIDDYIREDIAKRILDKRPELGNIKNVRRIYEQEYKKIGSWTNILKKNNVDNPEAVMYQILGNPKILEFIEKDGKVVSLLKKINETYLTFLITSSPREIALDKLKKIGINPEIFYLSIFGDYPRISTKKDMKVFEDFLKFSLYLPSHHVYIGDNIKTDIINPKLAGMKTIYVGKETVKEADFSVRKIYDIEKILF